MKRTNSPLALYHRTLAAGPESAPGKNGIIDATGTKIFVKTALQPFKVKLDTGEAFDMEEGFSYEMDGGDFFSRIELLNPNAAALDVSLYVGNARIFRAAPLFSRDAPTTIGPNSREEIIAFGSAVTIAASPTGKHRKQLVICNDSANTAGTRFAIYAVTDIAGAEPLLIIPIGQCITLFTSDALLLKNVNTSGADQRVTILETLYA